MSNYRDLFLELTDKSSSDNARPLFFFFFKTKLSACNEKDDEMLDQMVEL